MYDNSFSKSKSVDPQTLPYRYRARAIYFFQIFLELNLSRNSIEYKIFSTFDHVIFNFVPFQFCNQNRTINTAGAGYHPRSSQGNLYQSNSPNAKNASPLSGTQMSSPGTKSGTLQPMQGWDDHHTDDFFYDDHQAEKEQRRAYYAMLKEMQKKQEGLPDIDSFLKQVCPTWPKKQHDRAVHKIQAVGINNVLLLCEKVRDNSINGLLRKHNFKLFSTRTLKSIGNYTDFIHRLRTMQSDKVDSSYFRCSHLAAKQLQMSVRKNVNKKIELKSHRFKEIGYDEWRQTRDMGGLNLSVDFVPTCAPHAPQNARMARASLVKEVKLRKEASAAKMSGFSRLQTCGPNMMRQDDEEDKNCEELKKIALSSSKSMPLPGSPLSRGDTLDTDDELLMKEARWLENDLEIDDDLMKEARDKLPELQNDTGSTGIRKLKSLLKQKLSTGKKCADNVPNRTKNGRMVLPPIELKKVDSSGNAWLSLILTSKLEIRKQKEAEEIERAKREREAQLKAAEYLL